MSRIDELFILIPVLNNMKGNLEMNLSSRLGTAVSYSRLCPTLLSLISLILIARHISAHLILDNPDSPSSQAIYFSFNCKHSSSQLWRAVLVSS